MKIIADSSTLYSPQEGKELGITIIPVSVAINGETYKDYVDIQSEEFLRMIENGGVPTSSQPAIGEVMEAFEEAGEEEILMLSIGDGLSGAYQNAVGAGNCMEQNGHIHIIDTKTLAGPHRYLVQKAIRLREEGFRIEEIKKALYKSIESSVSFVIPVDLNFLKRSGRLTPVAAKIGGLIKIVPVLTQTADKKRIQPFVIKRSVRKAVEAIISHLKELKVDENYLISVGHAGTYEKAVEILGQIREQFASTSIEILQLSPALITHGGPGCITIQAIRK